MNERHSFWSNFILIFIDIKSCSIYNSFLYFLVNEVFHCVHFECPAQRSALTALEPYSSVTTALTHGRNEDVESAGNPIFPCISLASSTD